MGMSFTGPYDSTSNYALGNGVLWQGAGWVSLVDNNHGNTPSASPAYWVQSGGFSEVMVKLPWNRCTQAPRR